MDPFEGLIASLLVGLGTVMIVGAVKNRRVFGENGIITTALAKGSITSLADLPEAFPKDPVVGKGFANNDPIVGKGYARQDRGPEATQDAVRAIAAANPSLANNISAQLELVDETSTRAELIPLSQLLAVADAQGFTVSTAVIREYVKVVTDESI